MIVSTKEDKFIDIPFKAIKTSFFLHASIPAALLVMQFLSYLGVPFFAPKKVERLNYESFVQVDIVGLPDQTVPEFKTITKDSKIVQKAKPLTKTPEEEDPDVISLQKTQQLQKLKKEQEKEKALKKLKLEAKKEAALKKLEQLKAKEEAIQEEREVLKGNKLSKGVSTTGNIGQMKEEYFSRVQQMIKEKFNILQWQQKTRLVAVVFIRISPTGRVREKKIVQMSKDPLYDNAVMQAIVLAQPFPIPEDLTILNEGIEFEFKPEE
jgi:TonB family protein